MKTIEESVLSSLDGSDKELFPYLTYILQDLWELGANPGIVINLIDNQFTKTHHLKVLDLGCGKGAVSVKVAEKFGCHCYGIDAISDFIDYANEKAIKHKVKHLCKFETGDIREKINCISTYDVIILGAIGPVFGDYFTSLTTLSKCLNDTGVFIIDDGYIENDSDFYHPLIQKQEEIMQQINSAGMQLIKNEVIPKEEIRDFGNYIFENIKKRCYELIEKLPDKKDIFLGYLKKQAEENDYFEKKIICSTMVIKRKT